jgi:hypothetical protein
VPAVLSGYGPTNTEAPTLVTDQTPRLSLAGINQRPI